VTWPDRLWQDLQPTPGRLSTSLRIVLATALTLILLMTWQIPAAAIGLYLVFMVSRDSPAVSMRGGILSMLTLSAAVGAVLGVVGLTDNAPMARVVSVGAVGFVVGMVMRATTLSGLGTIFGFIYCFLIANWEFHVPADTQVRSSLWVISAGAVAIGCSVAVEYVFDVASPVDRLQQQLQIRYKALENLFRLVAEGVTAEQLSAATNQVTRLAASGQTAMQELYNSVVDRNLDPSSLPIGSRVHITMLAQLMDLSAAFASERPDTSAPQIAERCARIAEQCRQLASPDVSTPVGRLEQEPNPPSTLLDRIEFVLRTLACMPQGSSSSDKELIALPSKKVPLFVPGGLRNPENVAFALKLSLCATACYIFNHAVDWPGISTSVATVFLTALSTSGAIKQKLLFRLVGSAVGGLVFGIGATVFLFPYMDSITSLVVLVATVALIAAWLATGRYFNYIGLQIALAFYFVAFQGFGAPRELAPARDRFVGILVGLVAMWFVFDQIWPVRTITAMLRGLASVLQSGASLFRLGEGGNLHQEDVSQANALRDQIGKTVAELRTLNDAAEYEFGVELDKQRRASQAVLRTAFSAVAMFWNHLVAVTTGEDDVLREPKLVEMRVAFAAEINSMAEAVTRNNLSLLPAPGGRLSGSVVFDDPRSGEYARNIVERFGEVQEAVSRLNEELARD
jgi:multidrug resistance protein MdtO